MKWRHPVYVQKADCGCRMGSSLERTRVNTENGWGLELEKCSPHGAWDGCSTGRLEQQLLLGLGNLANCEDSAPTHYNSWAFVTLGIHARGESCSRVNR